ncbi:cysteine--1-D-myo-inosityl 2-amino-2-deoxy-alpha-D-glucopyranoside ligase [Leucobacter allii]|uniref:L-cysteine:1D-myo-inositol 2-amino-2-deoxy-alpha-D-glucopyranoside ligase n=1 Tax=Leucobacter allii TaxID=2932247 RepID=A0ABY4FQ87_9MICO|nr:cysteine--1-D-myo-inosityl 2-amino-2-deoxy-alpha-D-glucopyranoside ligase [Leucobacter allii]UOQ58441.1 cysteine--1-D-myo-inosityl 2-amino-2-deoxy-alpha-D-glucopyranoside ligase [Leucobacter allii]UOR03022.1 cysteine--1-D-myo-inosityl 2-amino-2-deoxy-alpha-D-glucopyranoside ligase [Leucobacter allii]
MRTWTPPEAPELPGAGTAPKLFNTATERLEHPAIHEGRARLYVCGITPYDATHLGHAFTYLAFDIMQRAWRDAGIDTVYAQNITDVDDPLLERAEATGVDWRALADEQIGLFRSDMHRMGMLPPDHYVAVTERIDEIAAAVAALEARGFAYRVPTEGAAGDDVYFDTAAAERDSQWRLGDVSPYAPETRLALSAERGGDPERAGKRGPLDPLLWRAARAGEPSWESPVGPGRPGWHVECSVIATEALGGAFTVQGGGSDLIFPHHEFTAAHATALSGTPLAHAYCHAGLVSYQGHKMSKSRGNLVFVSKLLDGTGAHPGPADPAAIRLGLLAHHYRSEWEWHDADLETAHRRLDAWRAGLTRSSADPASSLAVLQQLRSALANDLDTPVMLATLDAALDRGVDDPRLVADAALALLGVQLEPAND